MNLTLLKDRMAELNMSMGQLIRESGVSESTIKRIFRGKTDVHISTLRMIALAVKLNPSALVDDEMAPPESFDPQNAAEIAAEVLEELTSAAQNGPYQITNDPYGVIEEPPGVTNDLPSLSNEGDETMMQAINAVIEIFKDRITSMGADHEKEIKRIAETHAAHVTTLKIVSRLLGIATAILMLFVILLFTYDVLNPTIGWFQY